ncbi:MAG: hypothetical protein ACO1SV_21325 [Fimbriimonas sp.]
MDDREFDALARAALAPEEGPSERVWRQVRPPEPKWLPSFREIALATAVGAGVLWSLSRPAAPTPMVAKRTPPSPVAPAKPTADGTYVALNTMTFP